MDPHLDEVVGVEVLVAEIANALTNSGVTPWMRNFTTAVVDRDMQSLKPRSRIALMNSGVTPWMRIFTSSSISGCRALGLDLLRERGGRAVDARLDEIARVGRVAGRLEVGDVCRETSCIAKRQTSRSVRPRVAEAAHAGDEVGVRREA